MVPHIFQEQHRLVPNTVFKHHKHNELNIQFELCILVMSHKLNKKRLNGYTLDLAIDREILINDQKGNGIFLSQY
jgi:hypothetical protein